MRASACASITHHIALCLISLPSSSCVHATRVRRARDVKLCVCIAAGPTPPLHPHGVCCASPPRSAPGWRGRGRGGGLNSFICAVSGDYALLQRLAIADCFVVCYNALRSAFVSRHILILCEPLSIIVLCAPQGASHPLGYASGLVSWVSVFV